MLSVLLRILALDISVNLVNMENVSKVSQHSDQNSSIVESFFNDGARRSGEHAIQ